MCYSLYLKHMLVIAAVFKATRHLIVFQDFLLHLTLQIATPGGAGAACGKPSGVAIERACTDLVWPQKLWRRMRGVTAD